MLNKRIRSAILMILVAVLIVPFFATPVSAAYENTHTNTGNMRNDIIAVALTQVGYTEGANNYTKYGVWYGQPNSPWCGMFVSWCASQAGVPTSVLKRTGIANPSNFGLSYQSGSSYTPQKGDLFFKTSFSHVGFVYYTEGEYFYTIEGNTSTTSYDGTSVMIRKRKISDFYFSSPNYSGNSCSHNYETKVESDHPHKEFKICSKCNYKTYTGNTIAEENCKACIQEACSHTYSQWKNIDGSKHSRICSKCDLEDTRNHQWINGEILKKATCSDKGSQAIACSECGAKSTKDISATGIHVYTDYSYIDEANHQKVCDECNEQTISEHTLSSKWMHDNLYHWTSCADCGGRIRHQEHSYPDGCENPCETCGYISEAGHKGSGEKIFDENSHWEVCIKCGDLTAEEEHVFSSDCDETCNVCQYQRKATTAHQDTYMANDAGHWNKCSSCARESEIVSHIADQNTEEWETLHCIHCNYELRSSDRHEHAFATVECDDNSHWGTCHCGEILEPELHSWDIQTGACSICGIENEPEDTNSFLAFLITLWRSLWN